MSTPGNAPNPPDAETACAPVPLKMKLAVQAVEPESSVMTSPSRFHVPRSPVPMVVIVRSFLTVHVPPVSKLNEPFANSTLKRSIPPGCHSALVLVSNFNKPELCVKVPPVTMKFVLNVQVPEVAVKVPAESVKLPLMSMLESPPTKVPAAWSKFEEPTVTVLPVACVIVPV